MQLSQHQFGELVRAAFDQAALLTSDPDEQARIATILVTRMLQGDDRRRIEEMVMQ